MLTHILNRYIVSTLIKSTLLVLLILVGFEIFILFATQLHSLGKGSYTALQAFLYVLLILPQQTYELFPIVGLLGVLLGFSRLSAHSELIVIRTSGISPMKLSYYVLQAGIILIMLVTVIGEGMGARAKFLAEQHKLILINTGNAFNTGDDLWIKQGNCFYDIKRINSAQHISEVNRYVIADQHDQLISMSFAKQGIYIGNNTWRMSDIKETYFRSKPITVIFRPDDTWYLAIDPHLLTLSLRSSDEMSLIHLAELIRYQHINGLVNHRDNIAFWQRIFAPIATLVMMLVAVPFIFGPLRQAGTSLRLIMGVITGFGFYFCNQLLPSLSEVFNFSAWFAAILPIVFFFLFSIILLYRIV